MKLLDALTVHSHYGEHRLELYHGNLSALPPVHAVDLLIVSARRNNYVPVKNSLICALDEKGVSVRELAQNKAIDLREQFNTWLSHPIVTPNQHFKHVLCFEPRRKELATELVGDIFQGLLPFVYGDPYITSIAMPLVSTGRRNDLMTTVLEQLIQGVVNWFELGLPVKVIKLVEIDLLKAYEIKGAFSVLKRLYHDKATAPASPYAYDFFISYSHQNTVEATFFYQELQKQNPSWRIFLDRKDLNTGMAWQQELYEALDNCKQIITLLSPHYLLSKVCKEEFNIALARHREQENVLVPFYLYSAKLPTYMQMIQFTDIREFNRQKIIEACQQLAKHPHP